MYLHQNKNNVLPTKWQPVGRVKSLYVYPLKSGRRIELKTASCTEYGICFGHQLRDRCLVVYNEESKKFASARTYPNMFQIKASAEAPNSFVINAPGIATLKVEIPSLSRGNKQDEIIMWEKERIFTIDCGEEAARWFSEYLSGKSSGLRLGFHDAHPLHKRNIEETHKEFMQTYPYLENTSMGLYSNLSSYMLMSQSSVDDLVSRIPWPTVTVHNFRPNIVVEGENLNPYDEDNWDWIKIGEVVLRGVKPCVRGLLSTLNPDTGLRCANNEPLETLKTYRKLKDLSDIDLEGEDPVLGINMDLKQTGEFSVGELVFLGKN